MKTMKTLTKRLFGTCLGLVVIIGLCLGLGLGGASASMAAPFKLSNDSVHIPHAIIAYSGDNEDTTVYKVVVNHEEQYSIWPADRENPLGWRDAGKTGTKQEVLEYIKQVWTDMRPLSLRKKMEQASQKAY
jgi:MbtH protein